MIKSFYMGKTGFCKACLVSRIQWVRNSLNQYSASGQYGIAGIEALIGLTEYFHNIATGRQIQNSKFKIQDSPAEDLYESLGLNRAV